ncbi:MAG: aminoacyl-tRNA hydrolase [Sulfurovum sp.]|nr:aminoacyl-tRNA hydrolase [Sulfurovum sp.]
MLFVGLGNPGPTYEKTRHNIGFRVIDKLVSSLEARDISKVSFQGKLFRLATLFFLKPNTFMNLSGKSVSSVKQFFKINIEQIIVIHDDIDLPFGAVRFKRGGGHGGHNGLKSIDEMTGREYIRVRIGIGKPEHKSEVSDFVLHPFASQEEEHIEKLIEYVVLVCQKIPTTDLEQIKSLYSIKNISMIPS